MGGASSHTFAANTVTITGGSGSYSYAWTNSNDANGTWNTGGRAASFASSVSGVNVGTGCYSSATYRVAVTDNSSHVTVNSNTAVYAWRNTSASCNA